jgi:hypothetical protein
MTVTITFPKLLSNRLQQEASRLQIPVEELAAKLLSDSLPNIPDEEYVAIDNGELSTLEEIVERIKASPTDPKPIEYGEKVGDKDYLEYLIANPPQDTMSFAEWEEFWPQVEEELKALDQMTHTS